MKTSSRQFSQRIIKRVDQEVGVLSLKNQRRSQFEDVRIATLAANENMTLSEKLKQA
jgi:hypothetical protein